VIVEEVKGDDILSLLGVGWVLKITEGVNISHGLGSVFWLVINTALAINIYICLIIHLFHH
jgi:hypothetical protein